jgi:enoyl-CoA hydratase/carnithine racemase
VANPPRHFRIHEGKIMPGRTFDEYRHRYETATFERQDGILQVTMHTRGGEVVWGFQEHEEATYWLEDIGRDPENKVIILTGTGTSMIASDSLEGSQVTAPGWVLGTHYDGRRLLMSHLDIEAPMIAAINGPLTIHAEIALLCDIVIATDDTVLGDAVHFPAGLVPGDGAQIIWPMLLGMNRGRYLLLTGEQLDAEEAKRLGVVAEVMSREELLPRAWDLARRIADRPATTVRLTRPAMVHQIRKLVHDNLGYGLALEGLAALDHWPFAPKG